MSLNNICFTDCVCGSERGRGREKLEEIIVNRGRECDSEKKEIDREAERQRGRERWKEEEKDNEK
jgi:hypothetical protein